MPYVVFSHRSEAKFGRNVAFAAFRALVQQPTALDVVLRRRATHPEECT